MRNRRSFFCLFTILFFLHNFSFAAQISYTEIVNRLTDLKALAILPQPGETCAMWSSYDRRSVFDVSSGTYQNWDANSDGLHQYIRKEDENIVMAEMSGPGAIVRIWSAMPEKGRVKIYLDDNKEPVIDLPFEQYFNGRVSPFNYPELAYESARGKNNYVPITYQNYCKVVAEPDWGNYFHFTYISFPTGTEVEPFRMDLSPENLAALEKVNGYFASGLGSPPGKTNGTEKDIRTTVIVPAGETATVADITGAFAVTELRVRTRFDIKIQEEKALRKIVLQIFWDGEKFPSVWAPLGDFFGSTPGWNNYKTLPLGMTTDGMYSFW
ncbi:DUF2961 domain-containing protein [candidate division KSB1 bacterium]|nr:DUF2961 domain-containing protein [candidate division KSB1 bacterium]